MDIEDPNYHFKQAREDHDLMVRIDEKLKGLIIDMKDVKDNLSGRIANAEGEIKKLNEKIGVAETAIESSKLVVRVVCVIATVIIVPLLMYIWTTRINNIDEKISLGISKALDQYEIKVK